MAWTITKKDIPDIALGAKLLSCGGGGDTKTIEHLLLSVMDDQDLIVVKTVEEIMDEWIVPIGMIGSPVLYMEDIPVGDEGKQILEYYEHHTRKQANALISIEIGGMNALVPLLVALQKHLPVIDGDGMGRSFPELDMTTFYGSNIPIPPLALKTLHHEVMLTKGDIIQQTKEIIMNDSGYGHFISYGMSGREAKTSMIPGTLKLVLYLGKALKSGSRTEKLEKLQAAFENSVYGKPIFQFKGTIISLQKWFEKEGLVGRFFVIGRSPFSNRTIQIQFQNEFLCIEEQNGMMFTTPELILLLDERTLLPCSVSEIEEGQHVLVFVIPAPNMLRTSGMIQLVGPQRFGLPGSYKPFELEGGKLDEARN